MYFDSLPMLTLFRGGPTVWMNKEDAEEAGHSGQRLDRVLQPKRSRRRPGRVIPPYSKRNGVHAPCPGPTYQRSGTKVDKQPRRNPQQPDPYPCEADTYDRRLWPVKLRIQLLRADRKPA